MPHAGPAAHVPQQLADDFPADAASLVLRIDHQPPVAVLRLRGRRLLERFVRQHDRDSRIPLRHWCFAFWRASTSKKGVSALEIKRQTGLSYKSSLFMMHRIRFAMSGNDPLPLKGIVEVDETYVGGKPRNKRSPEEAKKAWTSKVPVMAMVERGGRVRSMTIPDVTAKTLHAAIRKNVRPDSRIMTDEANDLLGDFRTS